MSQRRNLKTIIYFDLVLPEYLTTPLKVVHFGLSYWYDRNDPFHLTYCCSRYCSSVPSAYEHLPKHTVAWVRSVQLECTVPLGVWNFQNFKQNFVLNGTYHEARCGRHSSGVSWVDKMF